jgi:hypothetical protein
MCKGATFAVRVLDYRRLSCGTYIGELVFLHVRGPGDKTCGEPLSPYQVGR